MPLFDEICHLATAKDAEALTDKIKREKICIDVQKGIYTPVMLLAQQGKEDAVNFLIHEFNASLDLAAKGYAMGGHETHVNALLAQRADPNMALMGYAMGGHETQVNALLAQGADPNMALMGYAIGGHETQVHMLLAQGADPNIALMGYAIGGHETQANALLAQYTNQDASLHGKLLEGYATGGHIAQVNMLLAQGINPDGAIKGYAVGGYEAQANALLAQYPNNIPLKCLAIKSYAMGGHVAQVNALLARTSNSRREYALEGYTEGGHIAQVNALLALGAYMRDGSPTERNTFSALGYSSDVERILLKRENQDSAVKGYRKGGHTENLERLLRVITFTDDKELQESLSCSSDDYTSKALMKRSQGLTRLMKENYLSYLWARAFTPALNFLFLQGPLLMKKGSLPVELLFKISSFISGFSEEDSRAMLRRHNVPQSQRLKDGRDTTFFRRQASLVSEVENNFLLIPDAELTSKDKSLTLQKSELQVLLFKVYPEKRKTFLFGGNYSETLNFFGIDTSAIIIKLKALVNNTAGDFITLEAVREAIHTSKIDFSNNNQKSGTDFVLTEIKEKFNQAAREQQNLAGLIA